MADRDEKPPGEPSGRRGCRRVRWAVLALLTVGVFVLSCKTTLEPLPPEPERTYQSLLEWSHRAGMPGAILLVQTPGTQFVGTVGNFTSGAGHYPRIFRVFDVVEGARDEPIAG